MHVSPSNKRYIGITCKKKPEYRWSNGKGYKKNEYFTNAIEKYGWDNFEHIIIARGLTEDEAKWLEIELIKVWNTTNRDKGYNITEGGEGTIGYKHTRKTKQKMSENHWDCQGENNPRAREVILLNTKEVFSTMREGAKKYNITESNISECCNKKRRSAGKFEDGTPLVWMWYNEYLNITEEEAQKKIRDSDIRVVLLNTNEVFSSASEGAKKYNVSASHISECCNNNGKYKSCGKHPLTNERLIWKYYKDLII